MLPIQSRRMRLAESSDEQFEVVTEDVFNMAIDQYVKLKKGL